jgi:hypothetical protein
MQENTNDIILYTTPKGNVSIEVLHNNDTFWLTQKAMAELLTVKVPPISKILLNIFETNELDPKATLPILETVQQEGSRKVKRKLEFYNLDAIIAVGYRVNSIKTPSGA